MARIFRDEDYRQRPNRKGSRPRTKNRPSHDSAALGLVTAVDRGRYRIVLADEHVFVFQGDLLAPLTIGSPRTV